MNAPDAINERVRELIQQYSGPNASAASLLCDRHAADSLAYTVVEPDLSATTLTYGELTDLSRRFAVGLATLGIGPGDRVATLMGKSADYLITLMGLWRLGAVHVPLFTAFAPPAIAKRLLDSATTVVVCDTAQRSKLDASNDLPDVPPWRIVISGDRRPGSRDLAMHELLTTHSLTPEVPAAVGGDGPLIHIYTSGTTGVPKAVIVPVKALAGFQAYAEFGLDLRPSDTYWCAADPGWAYGLYFGILGSFTTGVASILVRGGFLPDLTWSVLHKYKVTNLAAAPTVYRALRASGAAPVDINLRCASSAGEPLTPEVNQWATEALGTPVHDHYGQTEAGMLINNHHHPALARPLRPGSMGQAMPGWTLDVLNQDHDEVVPPGVKGRIAADLHASPLAWFLGYDRNAHKTAEKFSVDGRWYLTGDAGAVDTDGYFHFSARDDDVIIMAGYRIGPFDVESVLALHPNVVECAVIGAPDELRGEVLEAYVVLRDCTVDQTDQEHELQQLVRTKFAAHAYPRKVHFVNELPKTPSGKIQRFVLREQRRREIGAGQ